MLTIIVTMPTRRPPLPRIVRLYITSCLTGFALAGVFTGLVLWFNVANITHLVMQVEGGWLAALVFFMLNGIVFAGVQSGIAIMAMAEDEDTTPPRGPLVGQPIPVVVRDADNPDRGC